FSQRESDVSSADDGSSGRARYMTDERCLDLIFGANCSSSCNTGNYSGGRGGRRNRVISRVTNGCHDSPDFSELITRLGLSFCSWVVDVSECRALRWGGVENCFSEKNSFVVR
ncbi:hypothetical protein L9F63_018584, partial [Diploptera punctata]